jgi:hypothetical protein
MREHESLRRGWRSDFRMARLGAAAVNAQILGGSAEMRRRVVWTANVVSVEML